MYVFPLPLSLPLPHPNPPPFSSTSHTHPKLPSIQILTPSHTHQLDRPRPVERCPECGGVYRMNYIGPPDDPHAHHDPNKYEEPKTFADYVRPEYLGTPQPFYGEEKLD